MALCHRPTAPYCREVLFFPWQRMKDEVMQWRIYPTVR